MVRTAALLMFCLVACKEEINHAPDTGPGLTKPPEIVTALKTYTAAPTATAPPPAENANYTAVAIGSMKPWMMTEPSDLVFVAMKMTGSNLYTPEAEDLRDATQHINENAKFLTVGTRVQAIRFVQMNNGTRNVNVRVLDGKYKGTEGWMLYMGLKPE